MAGYLSRLPAFLLSKSPFSTFFNIKKYTIALFYEIGYSNPTMSQIQLIQLKNKETGEIYMTRKNKKKVERKIELKKFSKKLRKHVTFKEAKK